MKNTTMKRARYMITAAAMPLALFASQGCKSGDDPGPAAGKSAEPDVDPRGAQPIESYDYGPSSKEQPASDFEQERSTSIAKMQESLESLDQRIQEFQVNIEALQGNARLNARESMDVLKERRERAKLALRRASNAAESQWQALKTLTEAELSQLERSYEAALERLRSDAVVP